MKQPKKSHGNKPKVNRRITMVQIVALVLVFLMLASVLLSAIMSMV